MNHIGISTLYARKQSLLNVGAMPFTNHVMIYIRVQLVCIFWNQQLIRIPFIYLYTKVRNKGNKWQVNCPTNTQVFNDKRED